MSHFITLVFTKEEGKTVDELLAPYDEDIVVAPYIKYTREQAIAKTRREIEGYKNGTYAKYLADPEKYAEDCSNEAHLQYLREEFPKKLNWTDEECYEDVASWYEDEDKDEQGNLYSTYNPNSKWDWYSIGGRWNGYLKTLSGENTNEDYVSEIDWTEIVPFAFVSPDGRWYERGEMGWWACVSNEKDKDNWEIEFKNFIDSLGDDVIVTAVDCHI